MDFKKLYLLDRKYFTEQYKFNRSNLHFWPFIRFYLFTKVIQHEFNFEENYNFQKRSTISAAFIFLLKIVRRTPFLLKKRKYLFISTERFEENTGARVYNGLDDPIINHLGSDNCIYFRKYYDGRNKNEKRRYYLDFYILSGKILARLVKYKKEDKNNIKLLIESLVKEKTLEKLTQSDWISLERILLHKSREIGFSLRIYSYLLKKINPSVMFLNCASYSGNADLVWVAKKRGIIVYEPQHGTITYGHPAYNYLQDKDFLLEYSVYLPDAVLTFGKKWKENLKGIKSITIGKNSRIPQTDETDKEYDFLIISQWTITSEMVDLSVQLADSFREMKIGFKKHPAEIINKGNTDKLNSCANIKLINNENLYTSFKKTKIVVGAFSTAVFESALFSLPVLIYELPITRYYVPENFGIHFNSIDQLKRIIKNNKYKKAVMKKDDYWQDVDYSLLKLLK